MKFVTDRPFADADSAARQLVNFANATEAVQEVRIYIELINAQFLKAGGTPDQFRAALDRAITRGWLERHESGTYVKFTQAGAELFARHARAAMAHGGFARSIQTSLGARLRARAPAVPPACRAQNAMPATA
jgi:hypothetical protein